MLTSALKEIFNKLFLKKNFDKTFKRNIKFKKKNNCFFFIFFISQKRFLKIDPKLILKSYKATQTFPI